MSYEMDFCLVTDPASLSKAELVEAYQNISVCCVKQKESIERYKQKVYTLEQDKILKDSVQQDEIQALTDNNERDLENMRKKFIIENKDLHNRLTELLSTVEKLELENENLKCALLTAEKRPQIALAAERKGCKENEVVISIERMNHLERIEADHLTLIDDIDNLKEEIHRTSSELTQKKCKLQDIEEYYECCQENLKSKTAELDDARNIIDSMQEKILLTENELAMYKNKNVDHNIKGNSLFAEVDDQRQQMRDKLQRQKQQFEMMKQKYNQSGDEICRLKRENADMHNEMKECVNMFKNADKFYKSKLNEHIGFLRMENTRLTEKVKQMELEMDSLAKTHGIGWLSSMLDYCENETKDLKQNLMSYGMKKCEAEGLYAQAQELAAKWRFEALKSRCVIMNREMLLENNKINFEPKFQNVREIVSKLFSSCDTPIIDDSPFDEVDLKDVNNLHASLIHVDNDQNDSCWDEVKNIFGTISKAVTTPPTSTQNQQKQKQIVNEKGERSHGKIIIDQEVETHVDDFNKAFDAFGSVRNYNKENLGDLLNRKSSAKPQPPPHELQYSQETKIEKDGNQLEKREPKPSEQNVFSAPISSSNKMKNTSKINDHSSRVRQVSVEMFTVSLKRKNHSDDNIANKDEN